VLGDTFWLALALVLVIEGIYPFASPSGWRSLFGRMMELTDGQLRFFGLSSIVIGLVWIAWLLN